MATLRTGGETPCELQLAYIVSGNFGQAAAAG